MSIIYLLYSSSKSHQFEGIKNEELEVVETPPNPSPSFFKKLPNKVVELHSLPLLYSPSFFKHPNRSLRIMFILVETSTISSPLICFTHMNLGFKTQNKNFGWHHKFICFDIKILITHQIQLFLQINNHLSQKSKLKIIYIRRRKNQE